VPGRRAIASLLLHLHARLAGRRQEKHSTLANLIERQKREQESGLTGASGANQHRNAGTVQLFKRQCLLFAGQFFSSVTRLNATAQSYVDQTAPILFASVPSSA
jgi:hypothetical protein